MDPFASIAALLWALNATGLSTVDAETLGTRFCNGQR